MQIIVDSLMASYEKSGSGPVVLMLHGWGDSQKTFRELAKILADSYTVVTLDLPGFGATQPPSMPWNLDDYCNFVAKFLDKSGLGDPYSILGHSNGGAIAIRALASGKIQANRLILLASAGIRDEYKGRKKALRIVAKAAKVTTLPLPKQLQTKLKKRAYSTIGSDLFVAEHMQETFKQIVTEDVQADASQLTIPSLIIYGSQDKATPPTYGELFQKLTKDGELHIINSAGHFVHHDEPKEVSSLIQEFLR